MNSTLNIRIPDDLKKDLEDISKKENTPVSDLARDYIKKMVAIHKFRFLRKQLLPLAESEGILTDEDVFKIIS